MHAKYETKRCNVAGCGSPQQSLFLCHKHQAEYLSTVRARRLQEEVVSLYEGTVVYPIYANASVSMQSLPQGRFQVDLHAGDGRLGIGDLIDLLVAGIMFNGAALILVWIALPVVLKLAAPSTPWWWCLLYFVAIYPFALFRVAQLRRLLRVRRSLVESIRSAAEAERKALQAAPTTERILRHQSLDKVRRFPLLTSAGRGRVKEVVTVVLIPLAMLAGDKAYTAWTSRDAPANEDRNLKEPVRPPIRSVVLLRIDETRSCHSRLTQAQHG